MSRGTDCAPPGYSATSRQGYRPLAQKQSPEVGAGALNATARNARPNTYGENHRALDVK